MAEQNHQQIISHNEKAWDRQVEIGCRWTVPVSAEQVESARSKVPEIFLTSGTALPAKWIEGLIGKQVLLLAGGGGQQSILLAAFGCQVTVVDLSKKQLEKDILAATEFGLEVKTLHADAANLKELANESFDAILNPVSNCFFPELVPVWEECHRILKPGGAMMYGFVNPHSYLFDFELVNQGIFTVKYALPFSDRESLTEEEAKRFLSNDSPLEFGHTLDSQIGQLLDVGFSINGFFSDRDSSLYENAKYMANYYNVKAVKNLD